MVWNVCRRVLAQDQDADDAFQATFLVLMRKARSIRKHEALGSWLYGVACRVAFQARASDRPNSRNSAEVFVTIIRWKSKCSLVARPRVSAQDLLGNTCSVIWIRFHGHFPPDFLGRNFRQYLFENAPLGSALVESQGSTAFLFSDFDQYPFWRGLGWVA
jgi:hypothetical protein